MNRPTLKYILQNSHNKDQRTSTAIVHQLDKSNLWVHWPHLTFPTGLSTELNCPTLFQSLTTISLGHPQSLHWMFSTLWHNSLSVLQCTSRINLLAQRTSWWSHWSTLAPISHYRYTQSLRTLLNPTIVNLQQQTDLQKATVCSLTTTQLKQDLPLSILAPSCIQDWP